jgi:hypothetical protein
MHMIVFQTTYARPQNKFQGNYYNKPIYDTDRKKWLSK